MFIIYSLKQIYKFYFVYIFAIGGVVSNRVIDLKTNSSVATDELINKEFYRPSHSQKSLLLPPVRYLNTSIANAVKIMIAKNIILSSYFNGL